VLRSRLHFLDPAGAFDNARHHAAAQALKDALPDSHMELIRVLESGDEVYVTGRFKGTHQNDLATPLGTIPASGNALDLLFVDCRRPDREARTRCDEVRNRVRWIIFSKQ
jgi:hypothetical protein